MLNGWIYAVKYQMFHFSGISSPAPRPSYCFLVYIGSTQTIFIWLKLELQKLARRSPPYIEIRPTSLIVRVKCKGSKCWGVILARSFKMI